jgi:hypothetical protein
MKEGFQKQILYSVDDKEIKNPLKKAKTEIKSIRFKLHGACSPSSTEDGESVTKKAVNFGKSIEQFLFQLISL